MCRRFTRNYTWQLVREFLSVFGALSFRELFGRGDA